MDGRVTGARPTARYEALDQGRRDFSLNPLHHCWDRLINEARCPFLENELLRNNPFGLANVARHGKVIPAASDYDLDLIEAHLKRAAAGRREGDKVATLTET